MCNLKTEIQTIEGGWKDVSSLEETKFKKQKTVNFFYVYGLLMVGQYNSSKLGTGHNDNGCGTSNSFGVTQSLI